MNLNDLPLGYDDPLDSLLGFHRRIERQLAALGRLPSHIEERGVDAEASAAAATLVEFFTSAVALHHADEEQLMPLLETRTPGGAEREAFGELRGRLESEHREMGRDWRSLSRPLRAIAEGLRRQLPPEVVQYFRAVHATHISVEEGELHLRAARRLLPADRTALGRGMAARRTRKYRFQ